MTIGKIAGSDPQTTAASGSNDATLRDYFAAAAIAGLCARRDIGTPTQKHEMFRTLASDAFEVADAMVAARAARG